MWSLIVVTAGDAPVRVEQIDGFATRQLAEKASHELWRLLERITANFGVICVQVKP